jgi:hypothetical protein
MLNNIKNKLWEIKIKIKIITRVKIIIKII